MKREAGWRQRCGGLAVLGISLGLGVGGCPSWAGTVPGEQTLVEVVGNEGAWSSDFGAPAGQEPFPHQFADTFTLTREATVTGLDWRGFYAGIDGEPTLTANFTIRLFEVTADLPGAPQAVPFYDVVPEAVVVTELPLRPGFTRPQHGYAAELPEVVLPAGEYGLSIINDTRGVEGWWSLSLAVDLDGGAFARFEDDQAWIPVLGEMAFRLRGVPVPEPGAFVALSAAGGFIVCRRRPRFRGTR